MPYSIASHSPHCSACGDTRCRGAYSPDGCENLTAPRCGGGTSSVRNEVTGSLADHPEYGEAMALADEGFGPDELVLYEDAAWALDAVPGSVQR